MVFSWREDRRSRLSRLSRLNALRLHDVRVRRLRLQALRLALVAIALGTAVAHPDVPVIETSLRLEPGQAESGPMSVHYHRLVGHLKAAAGELQGLTLHLMAEDVWRESGTAATDVEVTGLQSDADGTRINHLVRCCLGDVYTPYRWVLRNEGNRPVDVDLRLWAVHDDFAVVVDRAEPGAFSVPLVLFLAMAVTAIVGTRRGLSKSAHRLLGAKRAFVWSLSLAGACVVLAGALALGGMLRYGAGPVDGMVAILADVPVPGGPFGSRDALVMGLMMVGWCAAIGAWARAAALAAPGQSPGIGRFGFLLGLTSLLTGVGLGWTYGAFFVPVVLGAVLGAPLMVCGVMVSRRVQSLRAAPAAA